MANREQIDEILKGSIDLHLHTSPDRFPRRQNLIEVAQDAAVNGMRAIVVKNEDTLIKKGMGVRSQHLTKV